MSIKRKISKNPEDCDGRIVRVKLKNFLTYDDCEFEPGPNLNVILGPNGTGKSSIVCAICLGLGGSPNLLGRARDAGDYVKHRTKEALIEIELLRTNEDNLIVRRTITKVEKAREEKKEGSSKSSWLLNGKPSNMKQVLETVGKMNVQMDNLCQFLPQDKVVEFAKMSPQQLLEATEKAVGPPGMHKNHMELIELRQSYQKEQSSLQEKQTAKERIEQRNEQLKRDVDRYLEREKHQEKIQTLEKKKPWVEYEDARLKFVEVKKDKSDLETQLKELRRVNAPMEEELKKSKETVAKTDTDLKRLIDDGNKSVRAIKLLNDKLDKQHEKIEEVRHELSTMKKEEASREKKILNLQREIAALEKDYDEAPDPDILKPQVDAKSTQCRELLKQMNSIDKEGRELQNECNQVNMQIAGLKNRIKQLESADNRRLEILRREDKSAYDVVLWLRENQNLFSKTVYEPIMTKINMKDNKDAVFVESIIPYRDMTAFVCQNREDQNLFANYTRDRLKLNVAVVCPPQDSKDEYLPIYPLESIRKFGFQSYLTDLFTSETSIIQYLCENYRIYNIPIGNMDTERKSSQVLEGTKGISVFCTPESKFTVRKSKYKSEPSISVTSMKKHAKFLGVGIDLSEKKRLDAELAELQDAYNRTRTSYEGKRKEQEALNSERKKLQMEKEELVKQMKRRHTIATQMETKKKRLENERKDSPDIAKEEEKALRKVSNINKIRVGLAKEYKDLIQTCIEIGKQRMKISMKQAQERHELEEAEKQFRQTSEKLTTLENAHSVVAQRCVERKDRARQLLKKAQEKIGSKEITPELQEIFSSFPSTVNEIEALIHEEQARLNCQYQSDPGVIKDYERNKKQINGFSKEIEDLSQNIENMQRRIDDLLQKWLNPLEELIKRINERYCDFFRRMGCAGEILLEKDPEDDYKKFGIRIQVKFRSENKLRALTSTFQSGGERSVSTMLYLISLQELTKCPFRLVDEINQGMDPNNERRVFELVVETVCRPNTSQYFLITPKLLPDLKYSDRMTILTVLNGPWMIPHHLLKIDDCIRRKAQQPREVAS